MDEREGFTAQAVLESCNLEMLKSIHKDWIVEELGLDFPVDIAIKLVNSKSVL